MTIVDSNRPAATGESRKTDWLVAVAALPITGAIGAAAYVHLGTTAWFAGAAATISYAAMLAVNKVVRRSRHAEDLRNEVALLQSEIERLAGRAANDKGPALPGALPNAGSMMPSLSVHQPLAPHQPAVTAAKPEAAPRLDASEAAPTFGRRKSLPDHAAMSPQPNFAATATTPAMLPDSYDGFAPWPEMPAEPQPALVAPAAAAPQPQLHQPQPARAPAAPADHRGANPKNYERLQHLVKQLASETGGPKASTPDPDRKPAPQQPAALRATTPAAAMPQAQGAHHGPAPSAFASSPDVARVIEAIESERVDVYLDPIQALEERKPRHFEVAVRFRDEAGQPISAEVFDPIVRAAGLGPRIDLVKLPRAARVAERVQSRGRPSDVLASMTGESLTDQSFIGQINNVLGDATPAGMVLSFAQADVRRFGRLHWETLATLSDMGFRFAVDHVTDLDMDFEALKARRFDFVKLDATVFLDGLPAAGGYVSARDICRHFARIGLALVVGQIANERELAEILGFGVLLGQGALFGAPRPVRQDILTRTEAA